MRHFTALNAAMATVIIVPCNAATERNSASKQTLLLAQRNNTQASDQRQKINKGQQLTNIDKTHFPQTVSTSPICACNTKRNFVPEGQISKIRSHITHGDQVYSI